MTDYTWNGASGSYLDPAQWTPNDVPLYGADDVATIGSGTVTLSNAAPNNLTLALGATGTFLTTAGHNPNPFPVPDQPTLVLSNGALGPDMALDVFSPAQMRVDGYDTNYGQVNVAPFGDAQALGNNRSLVVTIGAGSQLNQEGTVSVITPQTVSPVQSILNFLGTGTLNNDGQILIGPGSDATFQTSVTGSGTITVDHATASLNSAASTQTVDLLGGRLYVSPTLEATIKDWNSDGHLAFFNGIANINSVQFNQTSDTGGDLQLLGPAGGQVGDLHLLGTYATSDFTVTRTPGGTDISASGHTPLPA